MFEVVDEEVEGAGHTESQVGHCRDQTNPIWPMLKKKHIKLLKFFLFQIPFSKFLYFLQRGKMSRSRKDLVLF